ncbi:hypothetical protein BBO01nite_48640 [Brevibacillus borstelensis]|jgi:hypothetical protein|nr:hypothetical protein BBO01nite_48640 [Brevibacillus borstelensis]
MLDTLATSHEGYALISILMWAIAYSCMYRETAGKNDRFHFACTYDTFFAKH